MRPFEDIVTEYGPMVLRVCRAVLGPADAEDAWSETFLSAMRAYPELDPHANVEAWLVTIAHRRAIDVGRTLTRAPAPVERLPDPGRTDSYDPDLWAALETLPDKQRRTLAYRYLAGLPYAEIAGLLGGTTEAARRRRTQDLAHHLPGGGSVTEIFDRLTADDATLARLRAKLARDAQRTGVLDVAYRTVDTSVGPLLLAATTTGLVRVAFLEQATEEAELQRLSDKVSPRVLRAPGRLDDAASQIEQYLAGALRAFDLPLDLQLADGFRRTVVEQLRHIGYGHRASYAAVAAAVGNPRAVRAVGSACGHNPLPLVIPCHRVVRTDGSIGQYAGGAAVKARLLDLEAV